MTNIHRTFPFTPVQPCICCGQIGNGFLPRFIHHPRHLFWSENRYVEHSSDFPLHTGSTVPYVVTNLETGFNRVSFSTYSGRKNRYGERIIGDGGTRTNVYELNESVKMIHNMHQSSTRARKRTVMKTNRVPSDINIFIVHGTIGGTPGVQRRIAAVARKRRISPPA
jgi:hypothetical protein